LNRFLSLGDLSERDLRSLFADADRIHAGDAPAPIGAVVAPLWHGRDSSVDRLRLRSAVARLGATLLDPSEVRPGAGGLDPFPVVTELDPYVDLFVVRHAVDGSTGRLAEATGAAMVNAGDGSREDPLGALVILDALRGAVGELAGRTVALCGDLLGNPVLHALAHGLTTLETRVLLVPAPGRAPRRGWLVEAAIRHETRPIDFPAHSLHSFLDMVDTVLLTPGDAGQLSLFQGVIAPPGPEERHRVRAEARSVAALVVADEGAGDEEATIYVDPFRRGAASAGPHEAEPHRPARGRETAIIAALFARLLKDDFEGAREPRADRYASREGIRCDHPDCASRRWPECEEARFLVTRADPVMLICEDCGRLAEATIVASRNERRFHALASRYVDRIKRENRVFFADATAAAASGFVAAKS